MEIGIESCLSSGWWVFLPETLGPILLCCKISCIRYSIWLQSHLSLELPCVDGGYRHLGFSSHLWADILLLLRKLAFTVRIPGTCVANMWVSMSIQSHIAISQSLLKTVLPSIDIWQRCCVVCQDGLSLATDYHKCLKERSAFLCCA